MIELPNPRMTLGHMGIGCFDLEKMVDFYTRVLGFTITDRNKDMVAFMTTDPVEHHQIALVKGRTEGEIATGPVPGGSFGTSIFQISFRLHDLPLLREMKRKVEAYGVTEFAQRNHGNAWAIYFRDPEGNAIELYVATPWHASQPCPLARDMDLEDSDEAIFAATEKFCEAQPDFKTYDDWRKDMAGKLAAACIVTAMRRQVGAGAEPFSLSGQILQRRDAIGAQLAARG